jgi:PleD family two-component response regulator
MGIHHQNPQSFMSIFLLFLSETDRIYSNVGGWGPIAVDVCNWSHHFVHMLRQTLTCLTSFRNRAGGMTMSKGLPRILVVDDQWQVFLNIRMYLRSFQSDLVHVRNTEEALDALKKETFDLVILDVIMSADSGFKCLEIMRAEMGLETPVLVYSTLRDWEACRNAFTKHAQDFLNKADTSEEKFISVVGRLLKEKGRAA